MKKHSPRYHRYLIAAALGLASVVAAHAQLVLNSVTPTFLNVVPPSSGTIVNGASVQTFTSSVALPSFQLTSTQVTGPITFNLSNPADYHTIDTLKIDKLSASLATFNSVDLKFDFDFAGGLPVDLSITYTLTRLLENSTQLTYSITPLITNGSFLIGAQAYQYTIIGDGLTGTVAVGGGTNGTANINMVIGITAVPEPSTYALFGVAALGGIVAVRRSRGNRTGPSAPLALA